MNLVGASVDVGVGATVRGMVLYEKQAPQMEVNSDATCSWASFGVRPPPVALISQLIRSPQVWVPSASVAGESQTVLQLYAAILAMVEVVGVVVGEAVEEAGLIVEELAEDSEQAPQTDVNSSATFSRAALEVRPPPSALVSQLMRWPHVWIPSASVAGESHTPSQSFSSLFKAGVGAEMVPFWHEPWLGRFGP